MNLSMNEHKIMNHLAAVAPKPSSVKQLTDATKRSREDIIKTLKDLSALTLLTVGTKKEVWLRKAGKEFLGITQDAAAVVKPAEASKTISPQHLSIIEKADLITEKTALVPEKSTSNGYNHFMDELDVLSERLSNPVAKVKDKVLKVNLLLDLSEKMGNSAPHISAEILDIANLVDSLEEVA